MAPSCEGACLFAQNSHNLVQKERPPAFAGGFVFSLSVFPGKPSIVLPFKKCPVETFRQKKSPDFSVEALCSSYLYSWVGQVLSLR